MKKLNLGCGSRPLPWHVNVDIEEMPGVDIVHDLEKRPWPFADEYADEITGVDIFEHVYDSTGFMRECTRILKPGGILSLRTCYYKSENAYTDPDHKRFCTERSFEYWVKGTEFNDYYGPAKALKASDGTLILFEYVTGYPRLEGTELAVKMRRI